MTIATLDNYADAKRQTVRYLKRLANPTQPDQWVSLPLTAVSGNVAQMPDQTNTTTGLVPVSGDTGFFTLESFNGVRGFITQIQAAMESSSLTGGVRFLLCDRLWHAGKFATGSVPYTLSPPPDFSGRLPGGSYAGTMLWLEQEDNAGGGQSISLTYTNSAGVTGRTSSRSGFGPLTQNSAVIMPLQAGDVGIRAVTSINSSTNNNFFNLVIVRPLCTFRLEAPTLDIILPLESIMAEVFDTSALMFFAYEETSTNAAGPWFDMSIEIASG